MIYHVRLRTMHVYQCEDSVFRAISAKRIGERETKKGSSSVVGCSVKQARNKEDEVKIMASKRSTVLPSPRKYVLPEMAIVTCNETVQLHNVKDISASQKYPCL